MADAVGGLDAIAILRTRWLLAMRTQHGSVGPADSGEAIHLAVTYSFVAR